MRRFYPAVLERGDKDTFAVWFPDFPDCVVVRRNQEDAIAKAEQALANAVDALAERDIALPAPTPPDRIEKPKKALAIVMIGVDPPDPSERVNIYLPRRLLQRADSRAAELGMSRSSYFGWAVSAMLNAPQTSLFGKMDANFLRAAKKALAAKESKKTR